MLHIHSLSLCAALILFILFSSFSFWVFDSTKVQVPNSPTIPTNGRHICGEIRSVGPTPICPYNGEIILWLCKGILFQLCSIHTMISKLISFLFFDSFFFICSFFDCNNGFACSKESYQHKHASENSVNKLTDMQRSTEFSDESFGLDSDGLRRLFAASVAGF